MGNKLGRRRQVIDEKYTRPQGLYQHKDVDHKKLKKLILESKLAPCYPGDDECACELEECPICFLYYPSLNRSRCCMKGICTECFLQMKVPNSTRPTQCPFCKTSNYAVEFRGVKTKEEKGLEQIEEQRVIEAKIRMRQQELQDEEERMQKRQSSRNMAPVGDEYSSVIVPSSTSSAEEGEEIVSSQDSCAVPMVRQPPPPRVYRDSREDEFDLDLEDIMVMEAIWLSIQENGRHKSPTYVDAAPPEQFVTRQSYVSPAMASVSGSSSPSGGLACAIAALAERQQTSGESSTNPGGNVSGFSMIPGTSRFFNRVDRDSENYQAAVSCSEMSINHRMALTQDDRDSENYQAAVSSPEMSINHRMAVTQDDREWNADTRRTSYASSDTTEDVGSTSAQPTANEIEGDLQNVPDPIVPESFEEQMMLAMAVSLAEARAVPSGPGVSWQ